MIEQTVDIQTPGGNSDGVFYHSEDGYQHPGIVLFTDIGGIRPANLELARRLAAQGYSVLVPNVFYRTGRTPLAPTLRSLPEDARKQRMAELTQPLTPEAMERDGSAYVDFLQSQASVRPGKMGVAGYCFSGSMAMRAAAARPGKIAAAASFHGSRLFTDLATSPHLEPPRIKARLYFGHAVNDRSMPEEAIAKLDAALQAWGGQYESETYEGAFHSWTASDSPVYNPVQAERGFQKLARLFNETLS